MSNPERLRPGVDDFLERVFFTDVCLLYAPSQIALAAILHAASKVQENLDRYVTETLFGVDGHNKLADLIEAVRSELQFIILNYCNMFQFVLEIRSMVKLVDTPPPSKEQLKMFEKKLERCRNPENNPDSDV